MSNRQPRARLKRLLQSEISWALADKYSHDRLALGSKQTPEGAKDYEQMKAVFAPGEHIPAGQRARKASTRQNRTV